MSLSKIPSSYGNKGIFNIKLPEFELQLMKQIQFTLVSIGDREVFIKINAFRGLFRHIQVLLDAESIN